MPLFRDQKVWLWWAAAPPVSPLDDVAPAIACEVESEFAFDRDGFGTFEESSLDSGQALFGKADLILEMEPLLEGEPLEYDEADVLDDAYVELLEE